MVSRKPFYLLVALLYIVGLGMTFYHHIALDVPLTPGEKRQIWSIEAKLEFEATGEPVIASLAIPGTQPGFTLMNENAASPGYGQLVVDFVVAHGVGVPDHAHLGEAAGLDGLQTPGMAVFLTGV